MFTNEVYWTDMLERNKRGKFTVLAALLFKAFEISISEITFSTEIVNSGEDKILMCDQMALYWRHRHVDIFDGDVVNKEYNKTFEVDNTTFNNDLKINQITFEESGEYLCFQKNKNEPSLIYIIVVDKNITCNSPNYHSSSQPNEDIAINCSFIFNANNTCKVTPLWLEKTSNKNLTSEISSGYNSGYIWLTVNGNNGLKESNEFWLRVVFTCNLSVTIMKESKTVKEWKIVESIYDTNYISPEIKFPTHSKWSIYDTLIITLISVVLFTISFILIICIIPGRYRAIRKGQTRNRHLPNVPEIRSFIRNSIVIFRNPLLNHREIEDYKITPYSNKTRNSSVVQSKGRLDKSMKEFGEISEYDVIDSYDPGGNYEICD